MYERGGEEYAGTLLRRKSIANVYMIAREPRVQNVLTLMAEKWKLEPTPRSAQKFQEMATWNRCSFGVRMRVCSESCCQVWMTLFVRWSLNVRTVSERCLRHRINTFCAVCLCIGALCYNGAVRDASIAAYSALLANSFSLERAFNAFGSVFIQLLGVSVENILRLLIEQVTHS